MARYLFRRLLLMVPTFLGVTLVCLLILRLADADPMGSAAQDSLRGAQVSTEALEHLRRVYQLDRPWWVQYGALVRRLVTLDLGTTWRDGRPIAAVIGEALPITLLLSFLSLLFAYAIAIPLGVWSALRRETFADRAITALLFLLYALPGFWVGTLLLAFLAGGRYLDLFPLQGWRSFEGFEALGFWAQAGDVAWHLVLPVATLTYGALALLSRHMRSGLLESIRQDYVLTARAKGLPERLVVFKHAFRNSILPMATLLGLTLPQLIGGSVIVESIFGIRGMGGLALEAIRMPDYPLVVTLVAFTALLTMAGVLVSDLLYALIDPRIRLGGPR